MIKYPDGQKVVGRSHLPMLVLQGLDWVAGKHEDSPEVKLQTVFRHTSPLDLQQTHAPVCGEEGHYYSVKFATKDRHYGKLYAVTVIGLAKICISQYSEVEVLHGQIQFTRQSPQLGNTEPMVIASDSEHTAVRTVVLELIAIDAWSRLTNHLTEIAVNSHETSFK